MFAGGKQVGGAVSEDYRCHFVEEGFLAGEVPVDGGCLDLEFYGEAAKGQLFEADLVEELQRGAHHHLAIDFHGFENSRICIFEIEQC